MNGIVFCAAAKAAECADGSAGTLWNRAVGWLSAHGPAFAVDLAVSLLILAAGAIAIKIAKNAAAKVMARKGGKRQLFSRFVLSVIDKTCWVLLLVMAIENLGVDVTPIIAGIGVTGFILGFAFQESLGNLASGMMIAMNEPFRVGDFVTIAGHDGTILEVNMMATVLATTDNKKIVIPNKNAWGSPIVNYSAMDKRRVDMKIGVSYGTDLGKALSVANAAVRNVPGVLADPAPQAIISSLDDSAVTLAVRPWCATADYWTVYSAAYRAVKEAFDANGVSIPFPQLDVHLQQGAQGT